MGSSAVSPVVAGLAVGILFVVVFALLEQELPLQTRRVEPAPTADISPEEQIIIENKAKLDSSAWEFGIWKTVPTENGRIYVTGVEAVPPPTSGHDDNSYKVFFTKSNDSGQSFDQVRHISDGIYAGNLDLVARGDQLYMMWFEHVDGDNSEVFFTRSTDEGISLGPVVNVSQSSYASFYHQMAVSKDGNTVYAAWTEYYQFSEPQKSAILFASSEDGGRSFDGPVALVNATASFSCPQIVIQENDSANASIHVVWRQDPGNSIRIFFSSSHDGGRTFTGPLLLRTAFTEDYSCPQIAAYGNDVYVLWSETRLIGNPYSPAEIIRGDSDVIFVAIRDGGRSIEPAINLSRGIGDFTTEPAMVLAGDGDIYVAWRDTISIVDRESRSIDYYGNAEIIFTKSEDGGKSFAEPVNLSNNQSGSYEPEIAVYGDNVYVIWLESEFPSNKAEMMLRISNDGGRTFGNTIANITNGMGDEPFSRPIIVSSPVGDRVFIAWTERPDFDDFNADGYVLVARVPRQLR